MANNWPPTPPVGESPELASLRALYLKATADDTLAALVNASIVLVGSQGLEGGRVVITGAALHAGLFVDACSGMRLKTTAQPTIDAAKTAILTAKAAREARDAALASLPPEVAIRMKIESDPLGPL